MQIHVPTKYELYLQSPEFDKIRQAVFARDNHKCVVCGNNENIQPHHLTYRNVYNEQLADLITLCRTCHATYHAIQKRADYLEDKYYRMDCEMQKKSQEDWEMQRAEQRKRIEAENAEREKRKHDFLKLIIEKYSDKDYSKNGNIDMCDWNVIRSIIETELKAQNATDLYIGSQEIRDYFLSQRYMLLLRCMGKGLSAETVAKKTKLSYNFICKWYRKDKLEAKIEQFNMIYKENK